jgi:protocatechuate 3,4-dioxygenase beta subunit
MPAPRHTRAAELDDDDIPIGRILTRREVLALFSVVAGGALVAACVPGAGASPSGAASAGASVAASAGASAGGASPSAGASVAIPSCIVRPELTEGPYYVDVNLDRSDIRSDPSDGSVREGLPLELAFAVSRIDGTACTAFEGALVDVWHCDALGVYSGVSDPSFDTTGQQWLRGYQVTDADGRATFTTIYPGWYQGRTVHIHFKIRTDADADVGLEFTSQLFFDDTVSDQVFTTAPYDVKGPDRSTRNENDGIFGQSGERLTLTLSGDVETGFSALFEIGLQVA